MEIFANMPISEILIYPHRVDKFFVNILKKINMELREGVNIDKSHR